MEEESKAPMDEESKIKAFIQAIRFKGRSQFTKTFFRACSASEFFSNDEKKIFQDSKQENFAEEVCKKFGEKQMKDFAQKFMKFIIRLREAFENSQKDFEKIHLVVQALRERRLKDKYTRDAIDYGANAKEAFEVAFPEINMLLSKKKDANRFNGKGLLTNDQFKEFLNEIPIKIGLQENSLE